MGLRVQKSKFTSKHLLTLVAAFALMIQPMYGAVQSRATSAQNTSPGDTEVIAASDAQAEVANEGQSGTTLPTAPESTTVSEISEINSPPYWVVKYANFTPKDATNILWQGTDGSVTAVPHNDTTALYLNKTEEADGAVNVF